MWLLQRLGRAGSQLLGHELHVRAGEPQLQGDLPVGEVQAHEIEAQHPDPQRLMVPGQDGAAQIVEAPKPDKSHVVFQLAEVGVPRAVFAAILRRIERLRGSPMAAA